MATKINLSIDQGASFSRSFSLTDENKDAMDIEGHEARSQIRKWYTSSNAISFTIDVDYDTASINLSLDANTTTNMSSGRYVYDAYIYNAANTVVSRIVEGIVTVNPGVTK